MLRLVAKTKEEAHRAAVSAYETARLMLDRGERVAIVIGEDADDMTARQRRFLHGPVLGQISEQVRVEGQRYMPQVWKEYFRKLFLPDRWVMTKTPRWDKSAGKLVTPKRATPTRERQSTEDLGIKAYSELIDKVIAHATTDLGVSFDIDQHEREAVRYRKKERTCSPSSN